MFIEMLATSHRARGEALVAIITIVALLYIAVALVLTGMLPLKDIKVSAPLASAFAQKGAPNTAILVRSRAPSSNHDSRLLSSGVDREGVSLFLSAEAR